MRKTHKLQLLNQRRRKKPSSRSSFALGLPLSYLGHASLGLAGLLLLGFLFPVTISGADALDNTTRSAMTRISVDAAATVAVSLDAGVEMEIIPKTSGQFQAISTNLGVTTNNPEGYSLYISTADSDNALKSAKSSAADAPTIKSITSETLGSDFVDNTWGYTLQSASTSPSVDTNYQPLPTSPTTPVKVTTGSDTTAGVTDEYSLGFGVHINNTLPAGEYTNAVVASAVANPITITHLGDLVYMQDMTPEICANTAEGVEKQLFDLRDGQKYFVAKLRDGNCWMTQNLALDLKQGEVLTSELTDVVADYTVKNTTENSILAYDDAPDPMSQRSWNLGQLIMLHPEGGIPCSNPLPDNLQAEGYIDDNRNNSAWHGQQLATVCPHVVKDVSTLKPGYEATLENSTDGEKYDAHYLIGNYYQWQTATVGTGTSGPSSGYTDVNDLHDAPSSICPKGWKLPVSGTEEGSNSLYWPYPREDSFYSLMHAYGYPGTGAETVTGDEKTGWANQGSYVSTALVGDNRTRLDYKPLYFVRGGYLRRSRGALSNVNYAGYYWSGTGHPGTDDTNAYYMSVFVGGIYPSAYDNYADGYVVRCLAR